MAITPAEVYDRLIQRNVPAQEARQLVQQMINEENPALEREHGDKFQQADTNSKVANQPVSNQNGSQKLKKLDDIFPLEAEDIEEQEQKQIAEMKNLLKQLNEVSDDPIAELKANGGLDSQIADIIGKVTNGGQKFDDVNLDDSIRELKKTKLMEIQNKDWINYLAANNAAIKASVTLAASAR